MLRTRVRTDPRHLRVLFDNLAKLKRERSVTLNELPLPISGKPPVPQPLAARSKSPSRTRTARRLQQQQIPQERQPLQKFTSVAELQEAAENDDQDIRMFQQADENPKLLQVPNAQTKRDYGGLNSYAAMVDRATGLEDAYSTLRLSDEDKFLLRRLTDAMMLANSPSPKVPREVFNWLQRLDGRQHLLRLLTPYAWKLIWALDVSTVPTLRTKMIGDLMSQAGAQFTEEQEVSYIGALFWHNSREQAIERWNDLLHRAPTSTVWNLGIRLFALAREPEQAERVLETKIDMLGSTEHNAWIPIIMSYNHIYQSDNAWQAYQKLRHWADKNGQQITTAQYDDLAMSFLDSYEPAKGLKIYKDMLFAGKTALERTQTETYQNLASAVMEAQEASEDAHKLNEFSFETLKTLPPAVADKYFFAGWMKNLMKMGRTDLAWVICRDVLSQRGLKANSTHWNWVIQGFFEEGNETLANKAAELMIGKRLKNVGQPSTLEVKDGDLYIPPANIQTFSLLVNHYSRRQNMDRVIAFCTKMLDCKIKSNAHVMNHMLYALFRTHDMARLSEAFINMTTEGGVKPDLETFLIMWTALYKRYTENARKYPGFITPRELFQRTFKDLPPAERTDLDTDRRLRIWHLMIKSFMLAKDLEGALLCLHAAHKLWGFPIDETIVRETAFGVMKIRAHNPTLRGGVPYVDKEELSASVMRLRLLGEQIRISKMHKRHRLKAASSMPAKLSVEDGTLEGLTLLLKAEMGQSDLIVERMAHARAQMGLEGVQLGILR